MDPMGYKFGIYLLIPLDCQVKVKVAVARNITYRAFVYDQRAILWGFPEQLGMVVIFCCSFKEAETYEVRYDGKKTILNKKGGTC